MAKWSEKESTPAWSRNNVNTPGTFVLGTPLGLRKGKMKNNSEKIDKVCGDSKLTELKNVWKKEREEEKVSFAEVVKKQIHDKTKDTVIQVIKEKEDLMRDAVDRKKCMVIVRSS